jgi:hypothetical protein
MISKGLLMHGGVLVVAGILALRASTKDDALDAKDSGVEIWGGSASKLERIELRSKKRQLTLEAATDENGRFFVGTLLRTKGKPKSDPANPHAPAVELDLDDPAAEKATDRFIAVEEANKLGEQLAPMHVVRVLGKLDEGRLSEFGFDKEQGRIAVTVGGKTHQLVLGGATPGGSDVYARNPDTGEGYVVSGNISQPLLQADSRLIERDLHAFAAEDVERVRIIKAGSTPEILRQAEQKGFWSNPATPQDKDETASNWMSKLERLRASEYVENPTPPVSPDDLIFRVEYLGRGNKSLGYVEVVRRPPVPGSEQREFAAKTEHTRWYVSILRSAGEQLEQDIDSVLNP